jgi:hypothetical protein
LEETLLKKGFFQAIFRKLLKVFGKGLKGKTLFQKGFPLNLMTLPSFGGGIRRVWGTCPALSCEKEVIHCAKFFIYIHGENFIFYKLY